MNAFAAVPGWLEITRAGYSSRRIEAGELAGSACDWSVRADSVKDILGRDGHTITQVSATTLRRYGSRSSYFIPPSFLYRLRSGVTPHVCQIVALSESTGYRFMDWLRIFGFDLHQIPRLQIRLHPQRTILVTPLEDCFEPFSPRPSPGSEIGYEMGHETGYERSGSSPPWPRPGEWSGRRRRYLFVKIGSSDAVGCSRLLPGNILRVDRQYVHRVRGLDPVSISRLLWLVEHPSGLACTSVRWIDDRQIVLLPSRPPWGTWPLQVPTEARILGLVDTEIYPLHQVKLQPRAGPTCLEPFPLQKPSAEPTRFSDLLRISRGRVGLTFRAAHQITRAIARILGNREYGIALGMLSDYEAVGRLPRQIAKMLSLCIAYCMDLREVMASAGVRIDDSAKLPLPLSGNRLPDRSESMERSANSRTGGMVTNYARSAGALL